MLNLAVFILDLMSQSVQQLKLYGQVVFDNNYFRFWKRKVHESCQEQHFNDEDVSLQTKFIHHQKCMFHWNMMKQTTTKDKMQVILNCPCVFSVLSSVSF